MTLNGQMEKFLSLDGNSTMQTCRTVPYDVTADFEGDMFGNWQTSPDFQQNNSVFILSFSGSAVTTEQYQSVMNGFKDMFKALSVKSANRDSGYGYELTCDYDCEGFLLITVRSKLYLYILSLI
jgi:hypothetical protein